MLEGYLLVTLIIGLFLIQSILRIRNHRKRIALADTARSSRAVDRLGLIFSGILLLAAIVFYIVFLVNYGH
jgi:Flp pilus assembly protein protease CpaA